MAIRIVIQYEGLEEQRKEWPPLSTLLCGWMALDRVQY